MFLQTNILQICVYKKDTKHTQITKLLFNNL